MSLPLRYSVTRGNAAQMLYSCAECLPAKVALVESNSGISFSYAELWAGSVGLAGLLRQSAIGAGDRVGILLERGGASAAAYFAVLASGAAAVLINEELRPRQIGYILCHSGAKALLTSARLLGGLHGSLPAQLEVITVGELSELPAGIGEPVACRVGNDMAHLIYTSGSTGLPKGVVVSHANVWAGANAVVEYLAINEGDRIASLLPFSFDYGLNQLLCCARTGATLIVERTPVPQRIVQTLFRESVSILPAVPPLWLQLLSVVRFRDEPLRSLRVMTNTGGCLPTEAVRRLRACQPGADLVLMYGLTEAFRSTFLSPDKTDRKPASIGQAIPGAEILVVREDLTPCGPHEIGQLVHRGPTVALGYWDDPQATNARFRPNPLRPRGTPDCERVVFSGDLVRMDDEGDLYFVGRRDSMIKSLGHRVSPDEINDVLYSSGEIVEAVVGTEPDAMRGEAIIAYVVMADGGDLERLKQYAARELPRYMQPVMYEVRETLARTSSGKYDARSMAAVVGHQR